MQMKKIIIILLGILLIFSLTSCAPSRRQPVVVDFHEGTDGLELKFLERSPPDEVYEGDIFPLTVEMHNKGAEDITNGALLFSVERQYVHIPHEYTEGLAQFSLMGRSTYDPVGGIDRKSVQLTAGTLDPQSETHTTIVSVTACYPYKTAATAQVCVDTDIFGQREEEKVCKPVMLKMGTVTKEGQELPKGQGAPIAVTKIEQKMLQHPDNPEMVRPQYLIYVRNMGDGLPVASNVYQNACRATGISKQSWNVVGARVYLSDRSMQLNCRPKLDPNSADLRGHIKLEKKEDFVQCTYDPGILKTQGTYTAPLMIDLDYGYTLTISKNVMIRKQV